MAIKRTKSRLNVQEQCPNHTVELFEGELLLLLLDVRIFSATILHQKHNIAATLWFGVEDQNSYHCLETMDFQQGCSTKKVCFLFPGILSFYLHLTQKNRSSSVFVHALVVADYLPHDAPTGGNGLSWSPAFLYLSLEYLVEDHGKDCVCESKLPSTWGSKLLQIVPLAHTWPSGIC